MVKYMAYFDSFDTVTTVQITSFVRNLYFNGGLNGNPVSRRYIENIILTILPELRRRGKLSHEKLELKCLWINLSREKTLIDKQSFSCMNADEKFSALNDHKEYFKLDTHAVSEILKDCRDRLLLYRDTSPSDSVICMAVILLAIGTGARVVSNILKFTRLEVERLFNDGRVVCTSKHTNRCDIFIVDSIRETYRDFFTGQALDYPLPVTKRVLVYWYKKYIYTKFGKPLPPRRVLHEIRAWFIGNVNDTMGIRVAAKSVSHKNTRTTQSYVNRSTYNVDVHDALSTAFKSITV